MVTLLPTRKFSCFIQMFDINRHITTLSEVESFARYLYDEVKIAFHPDESFQDYVSTGTDHYSFSKSEAAILNQRLEECFNVCENEGVDIYEFMMQFSPIHSLMGRDVELLESDSAN